ncbi:MAG: hypothetical protein ACLT98_08415 [Eggerthellaceae bacterium]
MNEMNEWQGVLSAEVNSYDFFEAKGERYRGIMLGVAALAVLGGLHGRGSRQFHSADCCCATVVVLLVISTVMSRRSKRS